MTFAACRGTRRINGLLSSPTERSASPGRPPHEVRGRRSAGRTSDGLGLCGLAKTIRLSRRWNVWAEGLALDDPALRRAAAWAVTLERMRGMDSGPRDGPGRAGLGYSGSGGR